MTQIFSPGSSPKRNENLSTVQAMYSSIFQPKRLATLIFGTFIGLSAAYGQLEADVQAYQYPADSLVRKRK